MSLENLPYDVFFLTLRDLRGYEYIETVKALRLTSRSLNIVATGPLFESLHLFAHNSKSWMKMEKIQQQSTLVQNVRFLTVDRATHFESAIHARLDLASMPNLQEIAIKMPFGLSVIHLQRRRPVTDPRNAEHHIILSLHRFCDRENRWVRFISDLAKNALAYGFEIDLLIVDLGDYRDRQFWISILPTIDLRNLRTMSLRPSLNMDSTDHDVMASVILPALRSLPSLFHLIIYQVIPRDTDDMTCDLIDMLQNCHWPSVRHLRIVEPPTALTSFTNFLLLYQGQLRRLALYGECPIMTTEDLKKGCVEQGGIKSDDSYNDNISRSNGKCGPVLQTWIKENIKPDCFTIDSSDTWFYWDIFPRIL